MTSAACSWALFFGVFLGWTGESGSVLIASIIVMELGIGWRLLDGSFARRREVWQQETTKWCRRSPNVFLRVWHKGGEIENMTIDDVVKNLQSGRFHESDLKLGFLHEDEARALDYFIDLGWVIVKTLPGASDDV
jgi:hypothetical protein